MAAVAGKFRNSFTVVNKINWYPGHMEGSFKHMQAIMRKIDCVVEVHDARIPFSGRNPRFLFGLTASKPHILVLNKKDLIDKSNYDLIREKCVDEECKNVVFTNCLDKSCKGLNQIIPLALRLVQDKKEIYPRNTLDYTMMVVGIPNVGKSSLINALRNINLAKGQATRVGAVAGVTRSVQTKIRVSTEPPLFLVDTPGILVPNINHVECGMKLALCSCLKDSVVDFCIMADFLIYWMNKTKNFSYVDYFGLQQPTDEILPLLVKIATDKNQIKKIRNVVHNKIEHVPDVEAAAKHMITLFRKGNFGDLCLDKNHLQR